MKEFKKIAVLLSAFVLVLMFGLTSCQNQGPVSTDDSYGQYASFVVPDLSYDKSDISEATLENEIQLIPSTNIAEVRVPPQRGRDFRKPGFIDLRGICKRLNLTEEQRAQVQELMQAYRDCIHDALLVLRESEREIIQAANAERRAIMEALKNGEITREEAKAALQELNQETREQLQNNPARAEFQSAICDCLETLISGIEAILTEEQLELWNEWLASLNIPCLQEQE